MSEKKLLAKTVLELPRKLILNNKAKPLEKIYIY